MKRILLIALVLFVLGTVALLTSMNSIVAAAVEKAGTAALGVETTLDDADLGLMTAEARLTDLRIANPLTLHGVLALAPAPDLVARHAEGV